MGTRERRGRERQALRREILAAARELFVTEGYENVSMRRIAGKIEYSPTTIYLYFRDKSELLEEICEETFAGLVRALERIRRRHDDPLTALREGCRAYVQFGLRHPDHYRLTFMFPTRTERDHHAFAASMGERAFDYLEQGVDACVREGRLREVDVPATAQAIWAAIHGLTALLITDKDFPWVKQKVLTDHLIDTLIAGLRAQPEKGSRR